MRRALALLLLLSVAGCNARPGHRVLDFDRMREQPRYDPYDPSRYFDDGTTMRQPPAGVVAQDGDEPAAGRLDPNHPPAVPVDITATLLDRGRGRYDVFCRPCHDEDGSANSPVAANMQLRRPPSLLDPRIRALPAGRVYQAIAEGYGLMPSYARQLTERDRWAVVAYVRALQLRSGIAVTALPAPMQAEAARALGTEPGR